MLVEAALRYMRGNIPWCSTCSITVCHPARIGEEGGGLAPRAPHAPGDQSLRASMHSVRASDSDTPLPQTFSSAEQAFAMTGTSPQSSSPFAATPWNLPWSGNQLSPRTPRTMAPNSCHRESLVAVCGDGDNLRGPFAAEGYPVARVGAQDHQGELPTDVGPSMPPFQNTDGSTARAHDSLTKGPCVKIDPSDRLGGSLRLSKNNTCTSEFCRIRSLRRRTTVDVALLACKKDMLSCMESEQAEAAQTSISTISTRESLPAPIFSQPGTRSTSSAGISGSPIESPQTSPRRRAASPGSCPYFCGRDCCDQGGSSQAWRQLNESHRREGRLETR